MFRFLRTLLALVLLIAFESSCRKRRVAVPIPPPPASAPQQSRPPATPVAPSELAPTPTNLPVPEQPPPPARATPDASKYQVNKPSQRTESQPQQQTPPPRRSPQTRQSNVNGQPTQPPADAPRLGDVLTPVQEQQYNRAIDQSLGRARDSLGSIANRQLTKDQQAVVAQIQSFVQQAQAMRKSSLPAARSLAERAEVLARDLAGSLR